MSDNPVLSVVIGAYNAGIELRQSLESVLDQQQVDSEFIVVNDGSTDDTSAQLDAIAREDLRVKVFSKANGGLTSGLIRGCREARGKYIARHDIGDCSLPGRLRRQAEVLDANPDVAMVTCGCRFVGPENEILNETLSQHTAAEWTEILRSGDETQLHGPHHGSVMFRKAAYEAVGGYRPEFYFAQDLDLWTRLAGVGMLDYVPDVLYEVGFTYDSISVCFGAQQRQLRQIISQATQRRARGEPEDDLLRQAAGIRKPAGGAAPVASSVVDADYFVGSCLAKRHDPTARRYLGRVLRKRPLHARAWAKLVRSYLGRAGTAG